MRAIWSARQNCSHNVSQKVKHIRRLSDKGGVAVQVASWKVSRHREVLQLHVCTVACRAARGHLAPNSCYQKMLQPALLRRGVGVEVNQRKTKGQQLKGKIVSALFRTVWHFSTHFPTLFSEFSRIFPPGLFLRIKGFYCCFSSKRRKENKRE